MTATPVPWRHPDFEALFTFVQNPILNEKYMSSVSNKEKVYKHDADEAMVPYRYTASAFQTKFNQTLNLVAAGMALALTLERFMIRRTARSKLRICTKSYAYKILARHLWISVVHP